MTLSSYRAVSPRNALTLTLPRTLEVDLEVKVTQCRFRFVGARRMRGERALEERLDTESQELGCVLTRARYEVANGHAGLLLQKYFNETFSYSNTVTV